MKSLMNAGGQDLSFTDHLKVNDLLSEKKYLCIDYSWAYSQECYVIVAVSVDILFCRSCRGLMLSSSLRSRFIDLCCCWTSLTIVLEGVVSDYCFFTLVAGVWAQETIPVRTCFGPLIGQQSRSMEVADWTDKAANHIWKVSVCCHVILMHFYAKATAWIWPSLHAQEKCSASLWRAVLYHY